MSEPRQSSALAMFRLPPTQNFVSGNRSSSQGNADSSSNSFSAQLSSATEQSRRSMSQPAKTERNSQSDRGESAHRDRRHVESHDGPDNSSKNTRSSESADSANKSAVPRSGQKNTSKQDGAGSSTVKNSQIAEAETEATSQGAAEKPSAVAADSKPIPGMTEPGHAQAGLIGRLSDGLQDRLNDGLSDRLSDRVSDGFNNRLETLGIDESDKVPVELEKPVLAMIDGLEQSATSVTLETLPADTQEVLSTKESQSVALPTDGLGKTQQPALVNAAELDDASPLARGVIALKDSHVGDVISQAKLADHYRQLVSSPEQRLNEKPASLLKNIPELTEQVATLRQTGSELLSNSRDPLKPVALQSDMSSDALKVGGRNVNILSDTLSSVLKEQSRTTNVIADQETDVSGQTVDLSQRMLQVDAKKLATMNEEAILQRNLLAQSTTSMINAALSEASYNSSGSNSQSGENMFLSMPGGIVTAPLPTRLSTDNLLSMNAPLNVALLAEDADNSMASNIRWMVDGGVKNAVVNVTPSGMGPISVQIGMDKEQMNVSIIAVQGSTREALDSMLPRLREQLVAQGHDSVRVDISDGRSEHSRSGTGQPFNNSQGNAYSDSDERNSGLGHGRGDSSRKNEHQQPDASDRLKSGEYTQSNTSRYDLYV